MMFYLISTVLIVGLTTSGLQAQAAPDPSSRDAQKSAFDLMHKSLEIQRTSIQQQVSGQPPRDSFFQLPPPATLGTTTAAAAPMIEPIAPIVPGYSVANCDPLPSDQVDSLIESAASRESLDAALLRGVMRQESAFKPCAVSPRGAQGLMQLMPATAWQMGVWNPFDPTQNVNGGAHFLKQLLNRYDGNVGKALGAYNAGPAQVDAADGIPQIQETQDYVKQILSIFSINH